MILLRTLINEFTSIRIHVLFFLGSHVRGSPLITKKKHDVTTISTFVSVEIPPSFVGILMLKVIKKNWKIRIEVLLGAMWKGWRWKIKGGAEKNKFNRLITSLENLVVPTFWCNYFSMHQYWRAAACLKSRVRVTRELKFLYLLAFFFYFAHCQFEVPFPTTVVIYIYALINSFSLL